MALGPNILNTTPNQQARIDDLKKKKNMDKSKEMYIVRPVPAFGFYHVS